MPQSPEKISCRKRWRNAMIIVCILVAAFLTASYCLRSSMYLKARLTPKLDELGAMVGGAFQFKSVRAVGMTGIVLHDVVFQPNVADANPVLFKSITVYPALTGMFIGDLNASLVELQGADAVLRLDEGKGDRIWLESLKSAMDKDSVALEKDIGIIGPNRKIPEITCKNCKFSALYKDKSIEIDVPEEQIEFAAQNPATLHFANAPVGIRLSSGSSGLIIKFRARATGMQIEDNIIIPKIELLDIKHGGTAIHSLRLNDFIFTHHGEKRAFCIDNGHIEAEISRHSEFNAMSGSYSLDFSDIEIVHENAKNRIGIGMNLISDDASAIRIFGGYDFRRPKFALTFDTEKFDFARFFQKADFKKYLKIHALPLTGHISVVYDFPTGGLWMETESSLSGGALTSSVLARDRLTDIYGNLTAEIWIDTENNTFTLDGAYGSIGKLPFEISVHRLLTNRNSHLFDLTFNSRGESAHFLESMPKGFVPMITGYELGGEYSAMIKLAFDDADIDALELDTDIDLSRIQTIRYDPRSNFEILKNDAYLVRINAATVPLEIGPRMENWVSFQELPRNTAYAFVASEDSKFFTHSGFDVRAIRASLIADIKAHKFVRGGSTISQQVVKNIFLNHDKTASRKFQEAFLTWQMEKTLPKLTIFELYLNLAHFARDTYGIRAAAEYYFQKQVSELTLRESLFLACILPNPVIFGRQYVQGNLSQKRLTKMLNIGTALKITRRISAQEWEKAAPLIREGKISDAPKPSVMR